MSAKRKSVSPSPRPVSQGEKKNFSNPQVRNKGKGPSTDKEIKTTIAALAAEVKHAAEVLKNQKAISQMATTSPKEQTKVVKNNVKPKTAKTHEYYLPNPTQKVDSLDPPALLETTDITKKNNKAKSPTRYSVKKVLSEKTVSENIQVALDKAIREKAALTIQTAFRMHNQRKKYLKLISDVVKLQALARSLLARKMVSQMKKDKEESILQNVDDIEPVWMDQSIKVQDQSMDETVKESETPEASEMEDEITNASEVPNDPLA